MKKLRIRLAALLLAVVILLSGCSGTFFSDLWDRFQTSIQLGMAVPFSDMTYDRPDMAQFRTALEDTLAQIPGETDVDALMESVYTLYEFFYDFSTNYNLANIRYCQNMTDIYWEQEYNWCMENSSEVSAGMDRLLYALADCSLREELESDDFFGEGFFDRFEGESLWDEAFTQLMEQEAALTARYYELNAQALEVEYYSPAYFDGVGTQIEEVYLELIRLRQQIAREAGYESYPEFAYEFYYYRDYAPDAAMTFLEDIRRELVPLYTALDDDVWAPMLETCTEEQTYAYVQACAEALGGVALDAFRLMEHAELYDITYSENKYDASFEVFLMNYFTPFVFMCPMGNGRDQLTFVHEFGHFCNDYAAGGSVVGVDVAEVFSQGLEYLSLCYCPDTQALTRMKMADSLSVFVEQSAYASFEHRVYLLEEEALTVENVRKLYQQTAEDFCLAVPGRDCREYTLIPHLFISPMYVVSYVVSNDGAMQIYQAELTETGSGVALWENGLYTMQEGYMGFLQEAGLESPFAEGRAAALRKIFEEKLK